MAQFQDVPVNEYFKLEAGGRSFLKTSAFGYYLDPIMGEMQVQGKLEVVWPIIAWATAPAKAKAVKKPKATAKKKATKK